MKVLFATHNKAKMKRYKKELEKNGLEVLGLSDFNIILDVEETGNTAQENAIKKAKEYYKLVNIPTIAVDESLELEGVPIKLQPGTHVRRINGKERASDDEMIKYYSSLANKYGKDGKLNMLWKKCIAIVKDDESLDYYNFVSKKILTSNACQKRNEGYPLGSISIVPEYNKYSVELTDEENLKLEEKNNSELINFIKNIL